MLGKTHIVGSLALAHVGLLGYVTYAQYITDDAQAKPVYLVGVQMGESLSLPVYSLIVSVMLSFVLLLLRIGKKRMLMSYVGIIVLGLLGLTSLFPSPYPYILTTSLLCFGLGTLLPDIDSDNSTIGRYVAPISRFIPHRTYTHTIWMVLLIVGCSWYFKSVYLLALALGYTLHIVEDSFSKQGICWFYPVWGSYRTFPNGGTVKTGRKPFLAYSTGGVGEQAMFMVAIGLHVVCVGFVFWSQWM